MLCLKLKKAFSALSRQDTINKKAAKDEEVHAARLEAIERKVAQGERAASHRAQSRCRSHAAA